MPEISVQPVTAANSVTFFGHFSTQFFFTYGSCHVRNICTKIKCIQISGFRDLYTAVFTCRNLQKRGQSPSGIYRSLAALCATSD